MAVLPTPASPIKMGLFLVRRQRICTTRRISSLRPITGSNSPARANSVKSRPNVFNRDNRSPRPGRPFSSAGRRDEEASSPFPSSALFSELALPSLSEADEFGSMSAKICFRHRSKSTSRDCKTRAANPSPSLRRPSKICSVPT